MADRPSPSRTSTGRVTRARSTVRRPRRGSAPPDADPALQLDRLVHERLRLGILSSLAVTDSLTFTDLKRMLSATDGNVSVHARKLEDAGYIECTKTFAGRVPRTDYRLTEAGRHALEDYLDRMETLIKTTRRR